ncbi:MAG: glycine--tRNA ligase subunit beta [Candidatus Cloacimonetes bacterium]|nr:glycine--tRNA ligase subunit beta [Candidatus Cloacimonadota bacterium]
MHRRDMLIELGVEEIPAGYIQPAMDKFCSCIKESLSQAGLGYESLEQYSTPRRFGLGILQLESEQRDEVIERVGPAVSIAYDKEGKLTKAAQGFVRGAGANEQDIYKVESAKGEKIAVRLEKKGKTTMELLPDIIKRAIESITFPKTMRWGSSRMWFARPVRWLVSLYGEDVIEMALNGINSGRLSFGNRYSRLVNPVEISASAEYLGTLKSVNVIARREERQALIQKQISEIEKEYKLEVIADEKLLETVTNLVEYPTATIGSFAEKYLELPEKIIISTLSQNQKCFALREAEGKLTNKFIFTNNADRDSESIIRHGNEKVISARLADAEFYYLEDTQTGLEDYVEKLAEVLFQKDLGNLREKTERIVGICEYICEEGGITGERKSDILRTALLCKADLVTQMLGEKEFTKLQGYIGMKYALKSGENEQVAQGIYEHYQPRGQNDELPETETGTIVAIADKLDTVCGIMGAGLLPTGSNDPFALRRAANGIVSILASKGLALNLERLIEEAFRLLSAKLGSEGNNQEIVQEFFEQRINWLLKQSGIGYDVIESVMHLDKGNVSDLLIRAREVENFRQRDDFRELVLGFKRVSNIINEQGIFGDVRPELLTDEAERQLFEHYQVLAVELAELAGNYSIMMEKLVNFSSYINRFFDDVLVNVDEIEIRSNRYNLLKKIREEFLGVADLALIVVEEK